MALAESSWNTGSLWLWRSSTMTPTSSLVQSQGPTQSGSVVQPFLPLSQEWQQKPLRLQHEHSPGSAGRDGKQHTHCRLQLRENHHRQENHHQPHHPGLVKLNSTRAGFLHPGQKAEGKSLGWTTYSPTGHKNVCTDFSKTLMEWALPPGCNFAFSECPENHWKLKKIFLLVLP